MSQPSPRSPARRLAFLWAGLSCLAIGAVGGLVALPYSTSLISAGTPGEAQKAPNPEFRLGPLSWPVEVFSRATELEPFRQRFRSGCRSKAGIEAGVCVSTAMARAFPNGSALTQFVDVGFDPVEHLSAHFAGRPGHCMNRSAILVTELLAAGVPARVVQIMSPQLVGHTVAEVWDEEAGWTLIDPTFGLVLSRSTGSASAWSLISDTESVGWLRAGEAPDGDGAALPVAVWAGGTALYPEPWLYHRMGSRLAPWPYRARYVSLGRRPFVLGPAQLLLAIVAGAATLAAFGCFVLQVLSSGALRPRTGLPS